jgi:gamma-glutamylcyclotransferase (GGCT)/AIG2-like uncharacterized protein YtfP
VTDPDNAAWGRALREITAALARHGIPAQAAGGLAVRGWGGSRALVDLDFYVPDGSLAHAASCLGAWVVRGPDRIRSARWDIAVLTLEVAGCRVELGGAESARYRDDAGAWHGASIDFAAGVDRSVLGVAISVMPRESLIAYKSALAREVDLVDLHDLTGAGGAVDTRLAVYGTLAPGESNHGVVAGLQGTWTRGLFHGELHATGWGSTYGFPALRWRPDAPPVRVRLLTSADLPAAWTRLDRFEGPGYRRIVVPVTQREDRILANIYVERGDA